MTRKPDENNRQGVGVDAFGNQVIDPTDAVRALVEANKASAALLREADIKYNDSMHRHLRELTGLRSSFLTELATLRAEHNTQVRHMDTEIRHMESDRVDKIRSVDVANAAATAAQLLSAVTTLATTAQATAETLRNQVAATAAAVASQTERVVNPIIERIALLEKTSYTGAGKQAVVDPQMVEMVQELKNLGRSRDSGEGKSAVTDSLVVKIFGIATLAIALYAALKPH